MPDTIVFLILCAIAVSAAVANICLELSRDLMMFQQNSYMAKRYRNWLSQSKDTTSMWRLAGLIVFFIALSSFSNARGSMLLCGVFALASAVSLAKKKYKKPLVWTARARRIWMVSAILTAGICVAVVFLSGYKDAFGILFSLLVALTGCFCGSHLIILLANMILKPVEKLITGRYINDARRRLASMPDLMIVGITGSYGKTSTKHYLYRILSEQFDTLMTPGSFNTTLGVVRTIREYLKPYNEVFIVEMGAKNIGDIKEICDLVHPTIGIITAVGPQHLESFKTIERVRDTKFELADALPSTGTIIINDDFEQIASREVTNTNCLRYGIKAKVCDYTVEDVTYSPAGTSFIVKSSDGWTLPLSTRLMGEANVSDILAAVVCARLLGVPDNKISVAVAAIEPVEHRLSVKRTPGGITILDDAFNSNPVGSRMALEVLGAMPGGKHIVITPGMVELGAEQYELNFALGETIALNTDITIVVGEHNREALTGGIRHTGKFPEANLYVVDTFTEAQAVLRTVVTSGDTVLYENDLPDTFK